MSSRKPARPAKKVIAKTPPKDPDRCLNRREVAALIGVSPKTIIRWVKTGKLPEIDLSPGIKRYKLQDIEALMQAHRRVPA